MQYKNVFEDFFYSTTATTLTYRIEDENGEPVFIGRAIGNSGGTRVNVAQKIRDWLFNEIGDFRESDGEFFDHPDAIHAFSLVDMSDNAVKEQWMVIYSFQPWNGDTLFLTTAINTHASPLQKLFVTNGAKIDVPTHRTQDITDGGEGDGPGGGDDGLYFEVDASASIQPAGGYLSVQYTTNIPESEITPVIPSTWTLVSFANGVITFNVPENTGAERIVTTVPFVRKGATLGTTVVTQYAYADNYFIIDGETHIPFEGGEYTYQISTSCDGYNVSVPSGVTIVSMSSSSITLNYSANNTDEDRYLQIEFIPNCAYSVTLDVFQDNQQEGEYLTLDFYRNSAGYWKGTLSNGSYYSLNGGNWVPITAGTTFSFNQGDSVRLKHSTGSMSDTLEAIIRDDDYDRYVYCDVRGNILSAFVGDDFRSYRRSSIRKTYPYNVLGLAYRMFSNLEKLRYSHRLCMPIDVGQNMFTGLFQYCPTLRTAPALPSMMLRHQCYAYMFRNCTSLVTAPNLPAKEYKSHGSDGFYMRMFEGCSSLVNVQDTLPLEDLTPYCYYGMYVGCTSLRKAPKLPVVNISGITDCYGYMFYGCSSLSEVTCLAGSGHGTTEHENWLEGVSPTGVFKKRSGSTWTEGDSGIPEGWTVVEV